MECTQFASKLAKDVFPLNADGIVVQLDSTPAVLCPPDFELGFDLEDPSIALDHVDRSKRSRSVLRGLIDMVRSHRADRPIRLLTLSTHQKNIAMERLVDKLNEGARRFPVRGRSLEVNSLLLSASQLKTSKIMLMHLESLFEAVHETRRTWLLFTCRELEEIMKAAIPM